MPLTDENTKCIERCTYLLGFIFAEYGLDEMFSSIGLFTDGIGMLEIPLS
jgi:hypothetical protein